eukprot:358772-Chlamydomonas_euryale.AAC.21
MVRAHGKGAHAGRLAGMAVVAQFFVFARVAAVRASSLPGSVLPASPISCTRLCRCRACVEPRKARPASQPYQLHRVV